MGHSLLSVLHRGCKMNSQHKFGCDWNVSFTMRVSTLASVVLLELQQTKVTGSAP